MPRRTPNGNFRSAPGPPGNRRQGREKGAQVGDVLRLHADVGGVGEGRIEVPALGETPRCMALARSPADQPPMLSAGSLEMFGTTKSPKAVFSTRPPPSSSRSSPWAFAAAWQEAQPPIQNTASPRAASPSGSAARSPRDSPRGIVRSQNAPAPTSTSARSPTAAAASRARLSPPAVSRGRTCSCPGPAGSPPRTPPCRPDPSFPAASCAAATSVPNLASAAWNPAASSQIFGEALLRAGSALPSGKKLPTACAVADRAWITALPATGM